MIPQRQVQLTESEVQLQMMFLNQPADGSFFAGQRPSNFFSSMQRQFSLQSATVLDHWKGLGDLSPEVTPEQFLEIVGDRNVAFPEGRVTVNMAQRIAARYDREQAEAAYESNFGSVIGGFAGGIAPWFFSPEGFAGILVPPLRLTSTARAVRGATQTAQRTPVTQVIRRDALAQVPASIAVGGTNILAQQAAYGNVDALEASLAFGAPIVFGGAIGAVRGMRGDRAAAATRAANESVNSPPVATRQGATETVVPPKLRDAFVEWAGLRPADTTANAFERIIQTMQQQNIPAELLSPLVEAYARTGAAAAMRSTNREIRQAVRRLMEVEARPMRVEAPDARPRAQALDEQIATNRRQLREATRKVADLARKERNNAPAAATKSAATEISPQMRKLTEAKDRLWEEGIALYRERSAIKLDPDNAVPMAQWTADSEAALRDLADILARQTDHPMPAEFVAEFLEVAKLTGKVSPDAVSPPRMRIETENGLDATSLRSDALRYELETNPQLRAMRGQEGFSDAADTFARVQRIIDECVV